MSDYYLNVPSEKAFKKLKGTYPFEFDAGGFTQSAGWSVDLIGEGQQRATSWDEAGEPTYTAIPGFLINLRSEFTLPDELKEFEVFPKDPVRVWA